jgi:predicted nucleotide-binding protein
MIKYKEGEWYIFKERTTKSFERFKADATRGLLWGPSALFTTQEWKGNTCHISSFGSEGFVTYEPGQITCKVRVSSFPAALFKNKILSDVESITIDVCGVPSSANRDVFIVHGHNEVAKAGLKNLLAGFGLNPMVLSEMDDLGMTIIEKFEHYAQMCTFAFILMTPDDRAVASSAIESRWRARQNVIMELGWFMAHLGRDRVVILYNGSLEIPSDILGVVYVEFKENIAEVSDRVGLALQRVELIAAKA